MECMVIFSSEHLMKYHTIIDVSDWGRRSIHVTRMHQYHLTMVIASNLVNVSASFQAK